MSDVHYSTSLSTWNNFFVINRPTHQFISSNLSNTLPTEVPQELAESFAPTAKLSMKETIKPDKIFQYSMATIILYRNKNEESEFK